jgi:hypothetical protein
VAVSGVQCRASGPCGGAPSARRGPVSPNILQGHRGAQPGRHDAYQGYRPAMDRCLAWRPQPMVRLPAPWHRAVSCRPAFVERCGGDHVYGVVTPDDLTGTHQDRSAWDGVFGPVYEKPVSRPVGGTATGHQCQTLACKPGVICDWLLAHRHALP